MIIPRLNGRRIQSVSFLVMARSALRTLTTVHGRDPHLWWRRYTGTASGKMGGGESQMDHLFTHSVYEVVVFKTHAIQTYTHTLYPNSPAVYGLG